MKIGNTEYRDGLKKYFLKLNKHDMTQFNDIFRIHQKQKNFFSTKTNLAMFFVLQGAKAVLSKESRKKVELVDMKALLQSIDEYNENHNLEENLLRLSEFIEDHAEMVYYIALLYAPDVKLIQNAERLNSVINYLFNKGMDALKGQEDGLFNSYLTDTLLDYFE